MKKNVFYVTVGNNGGIITGDYERALLCRKYMRGHVYIRKFFDFEEAEEYLLDHMMEIVPFGCPIPEHCEPNQMLTIKKLLEQS